MAAKPVKVAYLADTSDLRQSLKRAEEAMESSAATAKTAGQKIDTAFESTAGHADDVASKGSQAAGALSGLGDLVGGKFGNAMMVGGVAMQGFADAGDLVNVVTESAIVKKAKDAAVTAVQTARNLAAAAAQGVVTAATKAWAVAQRALNLVLAANPIGLLIVGLVALGAALVIAYKRSETFRAIVNKAFGVVKAAGAAMWSGLKVAFDKITWAFTHLVPIGIVISHFGEILTYIKSIPSKVRDLGSKFKDAGAFLMGKIVDGIKSAAGFVGKIATGIWDAVRNLLNAGIDKINSALEFTIHIPAAPDVHVNPPNIPHLASGGIVSRPTVALIGEAGPEAVVPLNGRYGTGDTYVVNLNGTFVGTSKAEVGRWVSGALDDYKRSGGRGRAA